MARDDTAGDAIRDDTMAQTGPGIPDDAAEPGYDPTVDIEREHDAKPINPDEVFKRRGEDGSDGHPS